MKLTFYYDFGYSFLTHYNQRYSHRSDHRLITFVSVADIKTVDIIIVIISLRSSTQSESDNPAEENQDPLNVVKYMYNNVRYIISVWMNKK